MYKQTVWDLKELAPNHKSPEFTKQIAKLESKVKNFEKIKSKLKPTITSKEFFGIIHSIEDLTEDASRLGGYASLLYSSDTQSDEATSLLTKMSKLGSEI